MTKHRQELGRQGEDAAAAWYEAAGFEVLDRNWRSPDGELDLVCAQGTVVVFCEVKARSSARFGRGVEAVGVKKQRRIRKVAVAWLRAADRHYPDIRFDVVDVDGRGHLQVWEACF